ncbi:hypothetical protein E5990_05525 [Muribaculum caecicola]|uniref:Uncharacterized protein n=1 Tax=Muribaculum caecicola TaxID=3038144 RepID=A0AC61S5M5_9BACT|nr:hypothetical protein E5990_05525 [Muribaculum caecicola]
MLTAYMVKKGVLTIQSRPTSRCCGAIRRMQSLIPTCQCRQVLTSPPAAIRETM